MAVTYGFFNSVNGDRKYNADQMSEYFRGIVSQGVFQHLDSGMAVSAGTGLSVSVAAGRAIIQNRWVQNSAALNLTISDASETYGRKDAVVIRLNKSSRAISIAVKTGTPAASPVAPEMTRNETTYEMALAYVNVAAGASSVTVTDKRSDSSVCGWASVAQATSGEVDQMLNDMKTGFDGVVYSSPVEMVQGEDQKLQDQITDAVQFIGKSYPLTWTSGGGITTDIYVIAGETYEVRNTVFDSKSFNIYVDGHGGSGDVIVGVYPGMVYYFTPAYSGYIKAYSGSSNFSAELQVVGTFEKYKKICDDIAKQQSDENARPAKYLADTGFWNDGTINRNKSGHALSDYIPVIPGNIIYCKYVAPGYYGMTFYDEHYNIVQYVQYGIVVGTVPAGAYYMRFEVNTSTYNDIVIRTNPITIDIDLAQPQLIRNALDYIGAGKEGRKYVINVKNGTYDLATTFTADEINNADYSGGGWCGLVVGNNVTIRGESRDGTIITCEVPTSYDYHKRAEISTLNIKGNCKFENITIKSKYIRYPIHDDFAASANTVHEMKNCSFIAGIDPVNAKTNGYGLGTRSGETVIFDDCYIEPYMIYHNNTGFSAPSNVVMNNCEVSEQINLWDFACEVNCYLRMNNVKCPRLTHTYNGTHDQTIQIEGTGASPDFVVCDSSVKYNMGNCKQMQVHWGGLAGQAIMNWYVDNSVNFKCSAVTNVKHRMIGILLDDVSASNGLGNVQTSGYISANKLGQTDTTGWAAGDMLTLDSTCYLKKTTTESEMVAYVALVISSIPYIKLCNR